MRALVSAPSVSVESRGHLHKASVSARPPRGSRAEDEQHHGIPAPPLPGDTSVFARTLRMRLSRSGTCASETTQRGSLRAWFPSRPASLTPHRLCEIRPRGAFSLLRRVPFCEQPERIDSCRRSPSARGARVWPEAPDAACGPRSLLSVCKTQTLDDVCLFSPDPGNLHLLLFLLISLAKGLSILAVFF